MRPPWDGVTGEALDCVIGRQEEIEDDRAGMAAACGNSIAFRNYVAAITSQLTNANVTESVATALSIGIEIGILLNFREKMN